MEVLLRLGLLLLITIFCSGFVQKGGIEVYNLEGYFKNSLPKNFIYTKVPRGLILTVNGDTFFDGCGTNIKQNSLFILDSIAEKLENLPNNLVIEDHVKNFGCLTIDNWELSMMRSSAIADYFIKCKKIPSERIFDIGYGNTMPLKNNKIPDNRIDFVIIDYKAVR